MKMSAKTIPVLALIALLMVFLLSGMAHSLAVGCSISGHVTNPLDSIGSCITERWKGECHG
jgi:hypothetical protein